MKKPTKYIIVPVIQQNYGRGWEDNSEYWPNDPPEQTEAQRRELIRHDLKEYRFTGYATRLINRRVLNTKA